MSQTRKGSLTESLVNVLAGYGINFAANLLIFPFFGVRISVRENLAIGVVYTGISIARSYLIRRLFNGRNI